MTGQDFDVAAFLFRFALGGLIIASLPVVSRWLSPSIAGVLVVIPVVTLLSMFFIGRDEGMSSVGMAATTGAFSIPAVFLCLLTVRLLSKAGLNLAPILALSFFVWLVSVMPVILLLRR
jgi:uncharacterized membrane protein (GlpM family)